jgi:hypothetical protein
MTWLAVRALLAKVPAIAWVILFACALVGVVGWSLYHHGQMERRAAERRARTDSITRAVIVKRDAQKETDSIRAMARLETKIANASRQTRSEARERVEPLLSSLPEPVVTLIHLDDQLSRRDSVALVLHVSAGEAFDAERKAGNALDTLYTHQTEAPPKKGHAMRWVVVGVATGVLAAVLAHVALR